jgi:uncharacterized protein YdbL (DUF1318 family)
MKNAYVLILIIALMTTACTLAEVKVDVVSERTSLENQVLGTYNSLDREMLLVASVRGVDSSGEIQKPPRQSGDQKDAVLAMQTLAFHDDDLQSFKRLGWVGENNEGLVTILGMKKDGVVVDLKEFAGRFSEEEFRSVIAEINSARKKIMKRVIAMNEDFTDADLPRIRRVFGRLNAENALPGEMIQVEDGTWTTKK